MDLKEKEEEVEKSKQNKTKTKNKLIDRKQISCYQRERRLGVGKMSNGGQLSGDGW